MCYKYLWSRGRDQIFWVEIGLTAFKAFKVDFGQIDNLVGSNQLQVLLDKHSSVFNNEIGTLTKRNKSEASCRPKCQA